MQKKKPTVFGDGKQTRDFSYVENIVQANLAACQMEAFLMSGFLIAPEGSNTPLGPWLSI